MNRKLLISLVMSLAFIFTGLQATAQSYNHTVVTSSRDTIDNVRITDSKKTNYRQVAFRKLPGEELILSSSDVISHFDGKSYYLAKEIDNRPEKHLITLFVNGSAKIYKSKVNGWKQAYYLKAIDDDKIYPLSDYQFSLDSLFRNVVPEFSDFRNENIQKRLLYTERSIGNTIYAYNTNTPVVNRNQEFSLTTELSLGLTGGVEYGRFSWSDAYFLTDTGFPFGIFFEIEYDRRFAINSILLHNQFRFTGNEDDILLSRFTIEQYLSFKYYVNSRLSVNPGLGFAFSLNYEGDAFHSQRYNSVPTHVRDLTSGLRGSVDFQYQRKYLISLAYVNSKIPLDFGPFADQNKSRGEINSFRLSLIYLFTN